MLPKHLHMIRPLDKDLEIVFEDEDCTELYNHKNLDNNDNMSDNLGQLSEYQQK